LSNRVSDSVAQSATEINLKLAQIKPQKYQLVIDRDGSRNLLMEALDKAQNRLIIVCPWLSSYGADEEVIQKIELLLNKGVQVRIGWGHLNDIKKIITKSLPKQDANLEKHEDIKERLEYIKTINASFDIYQRLKAYGGLYRSLTRLQVLESQYPQLFELKLLGTHEKFLVCDNSFAMLGSHNLLTSNTASSEREIGLLTDDPRIISELTERYDTASDLGG